jgi:hypothetical protein
MDSNKQVQILQMAYAGVLADAVLQFGREGILSSVTERKHQEQFNTGKVLVAQFGITKPQEVFLKMSELFGCAKWDIVNSPTGGFIAQNSNCTLCAIAKKIGSLSPCHIYCLNPMEGLVKAVQNDAVYTVAETLWEGHRCIVKVGGTV